VKNARKRYVQVGLGGRSRIYTQAVLGMMAESSELVGIAANKSMKTGKPVKINTLVHGVPSPRLTAMKE